MKKILFAFFSFLVLQFSTTAQADLISAPNAAGSPGGQATLNVSFNGDISYGGNFTIGFESNKLSLFNIIGGSSDFSPVFINVSPDLVALSLAFSGSSGITGLTSIPIFSLIFDILDPYPGSPPYADAIVDIDGIVFDNFSAEVPLAGAIHPIIRVSAPLNVPEPGALALVALALLLLAASSRLQRVKRAAIIAR